MSALQLASAPAPSASAAREAPLPALREDLVLMSAGDNADGSPAWMIQDPVANRFYRIGWLEFEMLARWQPSGTRLLALLRQETPLMADAETLKNLLSFLQQNYLLRADTPQASERLAALSAQRRKRDFRWLLHHYLFIRIPLVKPDHFLARTLPLIDFVYTRAFAALMLLATLAGLWLVSRQWDSFIVSVQQSFTPAGILAYGAALAGAKLLHELGHAYTATRYGVRVAHMGVSLLVLFPMLYTDTSESWKLTNRRQRLAIVAAGMLAEIGLAGLATLGWSLAADGPVRSALFFLATTSWILSLGVNASPFMRFDGYFLLSDLLDLPNLHARSGAFARAFLRRRLLGLQEPQPEALPPGLARFLTGFALVTWLVRLTVFLGIALMVYLFFIKIVGILLFAVEIAWFIVLPVMSELKTWWARRREVPVSRRRWAVLALMLGALYLLVPLPHGVSAPAWSHAEQVLTLYAPYPARVVQVHSDGKVEAGAVLLALDSPDTRARGAQADAASATLWLQLQRSNARPDSMEQRPLLSSRLEQELAESLSADDEARRLVLNAPFAGYLVDLDPLVQSGVWVNPGQPLGTLLNAESWIVDAYVDQSDVRYLQAGDDAKVYLASGSSPLPAKVIGIDSARTLTLPDPMLDATHGGPIRVSASNNRQEVQQAVYRVRLRLAQPPASLRTELANVVIYGKPHTLAGEWLRSMASVAIRESGF